MDLPKKLLYSKEHVWVRQEEKNASIGITEFAQEELGEVVFVELPEVGDVIKRSESFGTVESVKTISELYAPLNGKVIKINNELDDYPEYVNESSYDKAWMIVVELSDESEINELLTDEQYRKVVEEN